MVEEPTGRHKLKVNTTKCEVRPCRFKSRQPYNREAQKMLSIMPEGRSKDVWIVASWKLKWEALGPTSPATFTDPIDS